ncbi:hypothetical protein OsJ_12156 [Oryza sativa Japonica Group]|uniref:Uncharacterized protein n=1 Tax=Oryza sativa subsp. japonica TaxID=39947 RepID=A3ALJ4_ORYSJ|nr:hypothetical protein OsJ_12156 [Oryza sativa Japonica Group]
MAAALSFFLLLLLLPAPLLLFPLAGNPPAAVLGKVQFERDLILVDPQDYGNGVGKLALRGPRRRVNNLLGLPLGSPFTSYATVVLSGYDGGGGGEAAAVKRALATLAAVICEGQRLHPILETILTRGRGARVAAEHLPYIEHWDAMWEELKRWRRTGEWGGGPFAGELRERASIGSAEEALAVVGWTFRQLLLGDGSIPAMCRAEL